MSWQERLKEAAYTTPGGVRIKFLYEDVSLAFDNKTTGFEFPDADGTYVQQSGRTGRRYPLSVIFSGDDYDLEANIFIAGLGEKGVGRLEHPLYGTLNVVPFGSITRDDRLVTAGNEAIIKVEFWDTIGLVYPSSQSNPQDDVLVAIDEYNAATGRQFGDEISIDTVVERTNLIDTYNGLLDSVESVLRDIANAQDDVRKQYDAIVDSINRSIDVLIGQPLALAFQTAQMIEAPGRAIQDIEAQLDAYNGLSQQIITGEDSVGEATVDTSAANNFHTQDIFASTLVVGSVVSVVNTTFETKTQALSAADLILTQFEQTVEWRDNNYQSIEIIDTGTSYQKLQEVVALAAGFLVEISFNLKQERTVTLDRNRTIIDLEAELYGTVDENIDFLINSNMLSGSEILELPKGRQIVYYV